MQYLIKSVCVHNNAHLKKAVEKPEEKPTMETNEVEQKAISAYRPLPF